MKILLFHFSLIPSLLLFLIAGIVSAVFADEPVLLSETVQKYPLGFSLEILEDHHKQWDLEDASSPEFEERFFPSQEANPNFGFTDSAYWIRFEIQNEAETIQKWLLELSCASMHSIDRGILNPVFVTESGMVESSRGAIFRKRRRHRALKIYQRLSDNREDD